MSKYSEFFLNCFSNIIQYEMFEISHSAFSQTYRIVRNATDGVRVKEEDGIFYDYIYCPMKVSLSDDRDDLDQVIKIQLGDLGEIIPVEMDRIQIADKFNEKPKIIFRTYASNDLETILVGPFYLEIKEFTFNRDGCAFDAKAPSLNLNKTGEIYNFDRFPMLRGML